MMVQSAVVRSNEKGLRVLVSVGMRQGTLPNTHRIVRSVRMRQGTLPNTHCMFRSVGGMRQGTLPNTHCMFRSVGMRQRTLLNTAWFVVLQ